MYESRPGNDDWMSPSFLSPSVGRHKTTLYLRVVTRVTPTGQRSIDKRRETRDCLIALSTYRSVNTDHGAKERLIEAAAHAFAELGYAAANVRHIAQAAHVTKPMLYYYFGSKEGLYRAVCEAAGARLATELAAATATSGTLRERLHRLAVVYAERALGTSALAAFAASVLAGRAPDAPQVATLLRQHHLEALLTATRNARTGGELAAGVEPALFSQVFHGALSALFDGPAVPTGRHLERAREAVELLLYGVAPRRH